MADEGIGAARARIPLVAVETGYAFRHAGCDFGHMLRKIGSRSPEGEGWERPGFTIRAPRR